MTWAPLVTGGCTQLEDSVWHLVLPNMPVADTLVTHMDNSILQKVYAWRMRGLQKQLFLHVQ